MAFLSQAISRDVVLWVFGRIHVHEVTGPIEQAAAFVTQVRQMQTLSGCFVLFCQNVDRFQARLIVNAGVVEIDHHVVRVFGRVEQIFERRDRSKE